MKVILSHDIPKLGHPGELKNVADGYARNFLIPFGYAEPATESAIKNILQKQAELSRRLEHERIAYESMAKRMAEEPLRFTLKMGKIGQTFGSVSAQDIAGELATRGFKVEKNWIELESGIKTTGEHGVKINFPHQVEGEIKVIVEAGEKQVKQVR